MWIRKFVIGSFLTAFLSAGAVMAMPVDMNVDRLISICESSTVSGAAAKGDELGWPRLTDAETEEWRTGFVAYNGGAVEVVGWKRTQADAVDLLSFWVATGPNGHRACMYSTTQPDGLLSALSERLGSPESLEKYDAIESVSASWLRGELRYSFTQVGSHASVNVGPAQ